MVWVTESTTPESSAKIAKAPVSVSPRTETAHSFHWPNGYRAAVSLSFDDARTSQIDTGLPLLNRLGVKATLFVQPGFVQQRLKGWFVADEDNPSPLVDYLVNHLFHV